MLDWRSWLDVAGSITLLLVMVALALLPIGTSVLLFCWLFKQVLL